MKAGRNDPCPCGSGKKYKQCCWLKDQQTVHQRVASHLEEPPVGSIDEQKDTPMIGAPAPFLQPIASNEIEEEPDPEREFWDGIWNNWTAEDYEQRLETTEKMLREQPELVDGGVAFDMFVDLYSQAAENEDRARFDALVELLLQQAPAAYEAEKHYFLGWRIENALARGDQASVVEYFNALAALARKQMEEFDRMVEKLAYHGELSTLASGYRIAWPEVVTSSDIMSWGINEFVDEAVSYEVFLLLEQRPDIQANDVGLPYPMRDKFNSEKFAEYVDYVSGRRLPGWTLSDLTLPPIRRRQSGGWFEEEDEEESADIAPEYRHLYLLTVAFIHEWHTAEGTPYTKAELAQKHIYRYLVQRHDGDLEPVADFPFSRRQKKKKQSRQLPAFHPLCPDRQTLDRYLVRLIGFLSSQYHTAGAVLEAVPAWLRFLQKYELINGDQASEASASLKELAADWKDAAETATSDPLLRANAVKLHESWSQAPGSAG